MRLEFEILSIHCALFKMCVCAELCKDFVKAYHSVWLDSLLQL